MEETDLLFLVTIHDVDGLPRAWGCSSDEGRARERAEREWTRRVATRKAEGTLDRSEERGETTVTRTAQ